jgi:glycosyltransferase involved in cell wall biosynthesis
MTPARQAPAYRRLIMLGTAFESRGGISAVVNAYRASGLFERWPIDYVPTHRDGGAVRKLLTLIKALLTVIALLGAHRRVVVHVHSASRASFWRKSIFMAIAMLAKCPVILHLHGGGFARFYDAECGKVRRRMIRFFLDRGACIIVLSERWRTWMTNVTENRRVVCIPNPAPTVAERPLSPRTNIVLFLGRLERRKGIFDLLDAIAALRADIPDIRLVCAGDGDLGSVARYAERLRIGDVVSLPGWVGPAERQSLMNLAAVYVLPSYAEGLPVSLLEAMAAGLPVAATSVGGVLDVIADGINGFLFAPGDSATLQRLLLRLMHDRELGKRMALAARETVRLRFSAERVLAQLDELYAGLGLEGGAVARECAPAGRLREAA